MTNGDGRDLSTTRTEIRQIIADILETPTEQVGDDTSLAELGVDSLTTLEIVAKIEKKYHVQIPEESWQQVRTLRDTVTLIQKYVVPS